MYLCANKDMKKAIGYISKLTNMNLLKILDAKANEIDSNIAKLKSDSNKLRVEQSNNIYLIDEELSTLKENELTNISLESKAEIFKRLLNKVTYISKELHYGVIILEYKNGITSNIICKTTKQDLSYALPSGFKYLVDTNQFEVQTSPQQPKNKSFNFRTFKPKYYTIKELINSFDLSEYVI
jgi:site-specific DNA recombinase